MKRGKWRRGATDKSGQQDAVSPVPAPAGWTWGAADMGIAAGMLLITLGACVPAGWSFHKQVRALDQRRVEAHQRTRLLQATLQHLEGRRTDMAMMRREVNRYVADVEARPIVPWSTMVGEISRRRPDGVWTTLLGGSGPSFKMHAVSHRPEQLAEFLRQLRDSPYVEYADAAPAQPGAAGQPAVAQVAGRLMGD